MCDVIIIGRGPAGLSAALYTARAGLSTVIIADSDGALAKAGKVQNYFGAPGEPSGNELLRRGREQARQLGVRFVQGEVTALDYDGAFTAAGQGFLQSAPAVILAGGAARATVQIDGIERFEGKGVSHCAVCDGFFFRNKNVAVLGAGEYALHEYEVLLPMVKSCTLLTNGAAAPNGQAITQPIEALYGNEVLQGVRFKGGDILPIDGLFIAVGVAGASELARKAGAEIAGNSVKVNAQQECSLPGLFAAGDCTGGVMQASAAVGQGAVAALSAIKYVRSTKGRA